MQNNVQQMKDEDYQVFFCRDENGKLVAENVEWWKNLSDYLMSIKWIEGVVKNLISKGRLNQEEIRVLLKNKRIEGRRRSNKRKYEENKTARISQMMVYYHGNTEEIKIQREEYKNRPETIQKEKERRETSEYKDKIRKRRNRQDVKDRTNERMRKRRNNNILIKAQDLFQHTIKSVCKKAIKMNLMTQNQLNKINSKCKEQFKCRPEEIISHFESFFKPWMNWDNHGKLNPETHETKPTWQYEHIVPLSFAFKNAKENPALLEWVFTLRNIRPVDSKLNHIKNRKVILEIIPKEAPGYPFVGHKGKIHTTINSARIDEDLFREAYLMAPTGRLYDDIGPDGA